MKIPKYIEKKINFASRLATKHRDVVEEVENWFLEERNFDIQDLRTYGIDTSSYVDCIDYGLCNINIVSLQDAILEVIEVNK